MAESTAQIPSHRLLRKAKGTRHHGKSALTLRSDHPAVVDGCTLFPSTVADARIRPAGPRQKAIKSVLKSGHDNAKLGKIVERGAWTGMPIYSLTLEERKTCPRTCLEWRSCYGNRMPYARRFEAGKVLERRLRSEIADLALTHVKTGFVVRLHVLGDFYSVPYVRLWAELLRGFPGLHVFGYTARKYPDPIGIMVREVRAAYPGRFVIRESGREAITIPGALLAPDYAIVCPAQTAQSLCCATCGLCWGAPDKVIAFVAH